MNDWLLLVHNYFNIAFVFTRHGKLYSDLAIKTLTIPTKYSDETFTEKLQN